MSTYDADRKRDYYLRNRERILQQRKAAHQRVTPEKRAEYNARYRQRYREQYRERMRADYAANREAILAKRKARREVDPPVLAEQRIKRGLPPPTRPCPDCCELCSRVFEKGKIHLDHDHATGAFRGWLCNRCNLALGHLGDSIAGLQRALAYLVKNHSG